MMDSSDSVDSADSPKIQVIGITGRKGSGKDTVGNHLVSKYGFIRLAFADPLKEACQAIFGFSSEQLYSEELKETVDEYWGVTPREVLQKVGTELFRNTLGQEHVLPNIGQAIWIRALHRKMLKLISKGYRKFVITDVRYDNELDFSRKLGYSTYSIKIIRPSILTNENSKANTHSSEKSIDDLKCDFEIFNEGTLAKLFESVDRIYLTQKF